MLGADTRATSGPIVADKNCEKIHYLAPNIFCCGAGTSADCDSVTEMMSSNLTLHRLSTGAHLPCFCLQLALPPECHFGYLWLIDPHRIYTTMGCPADRDVIFLYCCAGREVRVTTAVNMLAQYLFRYQVRFFYCLCENMYEIKSFVN